MDYTEELNKWLEIHDAEIDELAAKVMPAGEQILNTFLPSDSPMVITDKGSIRLIMAQGVRLGYYFGRVYQDVPEVFKGV